MKLISSIELAKLAGVSRQAVSDAVKKGLLRKTSTDRFAPIDLHDKLTVAYLQDNRNRLAAELKKEPDKVVSLVEEKAEILKESKERYVPGKIKGHNNDYRDRSDMERDKISAQTQKIELEIAQKLGELVSRDLAEKKFTRLYSILLNYFHTLSDRLTPGISSISEVKDVHKKFEIKQLIDSEVMIGLNQFKKEALKEL